ncbi:MAG: flagellar basal body-associated FliL family protein [Ketobacteraceae bacterium]|nr:flagellar basal body-associated FliL family protein [Ketobacteraceae bacterium]
MMPGFFHFLRAVLLASGLAGAALLLPPLALAEEETAEGEAPLEEIQYVPLKPAFITNYQADKLRYFKTDVTVKVRGNATAQAISRHLPYIRHNLVMLFSSQSGETLNSTEGKQKLQEDAATQVIAVLNEENETSQVEGILFTSFIVE